MSVPAYAFQLSRFDSLLSTFSKPIKFVLATFDGSIPYSVCLHSLPPYNELLISIELPSSASLRTVGLIPDLCGVVLDGLQASSDLPPKLVWSLSMERKKDGKGKNRLFSIEFPDPENLRVFRLDSLLVN